MVGLEEAKTLLNSKRSITGSVATVDDWDLISHYRKFVAHLGTLFIQSILKKENIVLFSNVNIMSILFALRVESLLSRYKKHIVQTQHSLSEMVISENGPLLYHADDIVAIAMIQYWRVGNSDGK